MEKVLIVNGTEEALERLKEFCTLYDITLNENPDADDVEDTMWANSQEWNSSSC